MEELNSHCEPIGDQDKNKTGKVGRPVTNPKTLAQHFPPIPLIKEKLGNGECFCRCRSSTSSEVWSLFEEVVYSSNEEFTGIVRCRSCALMTRYHGQITGTSHLRRHHCFAATFSSASNSNACKSSTANLKEKRSALNRKRKEPTYDAAVAEDYALDWNNIFEKFTEVKDAISQEFIGYLSCNSCKALIKKELPNVNTHICKAKDLDRQTLSPTFTDTLLFRVKPKSRATPIWEDFEEVIDPSTNTILGYVRCKRCREIFKASDPKSIPAALRRHIPLCSMEFTPTNSFSLPMPDNIGPDNIDSPNLTSLGSNSSQTSIGPKVINAKADFRQKCIQFCYSELVSLETVTSESFRRLAQSLMSLGAQYGRSTLVLPDVSQLQSLMHTYYEQSKNELKNQLLMEMNKNIGGALVCDSQDDLCILSAYYIDSDWTLVKTVLSATTCASDINSFITSTLNDYGLNDEEKLCKFTFVSRGGMFDGASICLTSISHLIDQIIESTLFSDDIYSDLIENCKIICSELGVDIHLDPLIENVDWIYKYELMNNVLLYRDKFELKNSSLDLDAIKCKVDLLTPFRDASFELRQCDRHPTLNHVLLWYYKLLKVLDSEPKNEEGRVCNQHQDRNDPDDLETNFKLLIKRGLEPNFTLHSLHKIAAFLWPNFRYLKMLSHEEREVVQCEIRNLIETRLSHEIESSDIAKKARSEFSDWEDSNDNEQDEIEKYMSAMLTTCNEQNLLQWWKEHSNDFPRLSRLAKWILAVPASVTLLERFKLYSTQKVDKELLFLYCNSRKTRFSSINKSIPRPSWKQKMEIKAKDKAIRLRDQEMKEERKQRIEEKIRRREENRKRKEENERKAEIVVPIKNIAKLKRLSKKERKKIRKG